MRFQLVMSLLVSFSALSTSALAKECKERKQELMYVQCQYVDLLSGKEDSQWAVDQTESFVAVVGIKNTDNIFVTHQNEQLVKDFCTYTKRAHYGEDKSTFFEDAGMLASPSSFGKSIPLVFDSETAYPANVDPDWAKNLKPGKVKPKNYNRLRIKKAIGVATLLAGIGLGHAVVGKEWFNIIEKLGSSTLVAIAAVNFIGDETLDWDKAGKVIEKAEKAGGKFKPKKDDDKKDDKSIAKEDDDKPKND